MIQQALMYLISHPVAGLGALIGLLVAAFKYEHSQVQRLKMDNLLLKSGSELAELEKEEKAQNQKSIAIKKEIDNEQN